jgi:hypothetical protein
VINLPSVATGKYRSANPENMRLDIEILNCIFPRFCPGHLRVGLRERLKHWGLFAILLLLFDCQLFSSEKYSIAGESDLVVVGRLTNYSSVRRDGGWHFSGTIVFEERLFGAVPSSRNLRYRFACTCCPSLRRPSMHALANEKGLWFLLRVGRSEEWESAGSCSDPGYRPLTYLEDMRRFLRSRAAGRTQ